MGNLHQQYEGFLNTPSLLEHVPHTFSVFPLNPTIIPSQEELHNQIHIHHNEVLGKRIEHFFEYYLKTHPVYDLLRSSVQVFEEKQTIGELDFLVKNLHTHRYLHIELVYKFYIYDPKIATQYETRWIGPNRNDSYLQKATKLSQKQLPLLYNKCTGSILETLGLTPYDFDQKVCFLTQLYLPSDIKSSETFVKSSLPIAGYWSTLNDFKVNASKKNLYYLPLKKEWVVDPMHGEKWISYNEIISQIELCCRKNKSPLVWIKTRENYQRMFVTFS
ncbi:DUF1853 family protein [Aquimarina sp. W85]|uniref:DUF1853 family protein n=1 Tax=Aquimarina rhodophyticola TaxID=3342246 RepID=UPI003672328D